MRDFEGTTVNRLEAALERDGLPESAVDDLFNVSPDGVLVTDCNGLIHAANPSAAQMFGYTQSELRGKPIEDLIPASFRSHHITHRENFVACPRTRRMGAALNLRALRRDGREFPVDIMLKPRKTASGIMMLSIVRDISDLRLAQEELHRTDQQLSAMVESVRDHAICLMDPKGHILSWNKGAERIFGYASDDIVGLHFSRLHVKESGANYAADLLREAEQQGRVEVQSWRVRKDCTRFWADVTIVALRDASGPLTGFAVVTRDFNDRKRAEESVMLQLTTALLANVDASKLLDAVSASVRAIIPHDCVTVALYDTKSGDLQAQILSSVEERSQRGELRLSLQDSPDGTVFRTRQPILLERISDSLFDCESVRHLTMMGMQSGCWVPLIQSGESIGALSVSSCLTAAFSQHDADLLAQIADQVAMAIGKDLTMQRIAEMRDRLRQEKQYLEAQIDLEHRYDDIVGKSPALLHVLSQVESVAPTDSTVLIEGETGTGKELLARAIHRLSPRNGRSFIKLNCAAVPAGLLESELFGHEKGAFSGAIARKIGLVELAHEGTLFLDEIGELPLELQPKLLRALQDREITRIGGSHPTRLNFRLIAATNRNLRQMVASKEFRSDLFYRLKVFPICAPSLRERQGDIPILVRHFVNLHSRRLGRSVEMIPDQVMDALVDWKWPGNIRELENFLERSVILTRGSVLYVPLAELEAQQDTAYDSLPGNSTLEEAERAHIIGVLRDAKGQVSTAAERLGLKRTTLYSKLIKLKIQRGDYI